MYNRTNQDSDDKLKNQILEQIAKQGSIQLGIQSNSYRVALQLVNEGLIKMDKTDSNYLSGDLYRTFKANP